MDYRIVVDTGCDITEEMEREMNILSVPFKITVDDVEFVDDENINLDEFLDSMIKSNNPIRTSCPSPYDYLEKLNKCEEKNIFVVTISSKVSGSYNSAVIAKNDYVSEHPDKNVFIVDSKSASAGQTSVVLKLWEIINEASSFEEKTKKITTEVDNNKTFFILESLDNLIKNGRIKKTAGLIANILNIRPIMTTDDGDICLFEMNRGFKKSLSKLANAIGNVASNLEEKVLVISHVDALEKAKDLEKKVRELYKIKDVIIIHTRGLSSGYADNGGIVIGL
ncbi:DegV family protein [Peptoniphilus mikwangii]|uniref:DegV family protein n=1 Tax=Peptoniphilus mikwangii TaxID=1354300 RepID=UPI00040EBBC6|nr:DegV family protein [Peptoniphilus mikwangii]